MPINYVELIKRSFENAWRYKFLWLFGLFVSNGVGIAFNTNLGGAESGADNLARFQTIFLDPASMILFGIVLILIGLAISVLSIVSEGALIHGIVQKEQGRTTRFSYCWSVGLDKFLRLLGLSMLLAAAIVGMVLVMVLFVIILGLVHPILAVLTGIVAFAVYLAGFVVGLCILGWAMRYAVLYDFVWDESIKRGWNLMKRNPRETLGIAFASFFLQVGIGLVYLLFVYSASIPFVSRSFSDVWTLTNPGYLILLPFGIVMAIILGTFASSMWTLGFLQLETRSFDEPSIAMATPGDIKPPAALATPPPSRHTWTCRCGEINLRAAGECRACGEPAPTDQPRS